MSESVSRDGAPDPASCLRLPPKLTSSHASPLGYFSDAVTGFKAEEKNTLGEETRVHNHLPPVPDKPPFRVATARTSTPGSHFRRSRDQPRMGQGYLRRVIRKDATSPSPPGVRERIVVSDAGRRISHGQLPLISLLPASEFNHTGR